MAKSAQVGALHTTLTLEGKQFEDGFKRAAQHSRRFRGEVNQQGGALDRLNMTMGKYGQALRVLRGGAVVAGVAMLGRGIASVAETFAKARESGESFFGSLARSLPLVSSFVRTFDALGRAMAAPSAAERERREDWLITHRLRGEAAERVNRRAMEEAERVRKGPARIAAEATAAAVERMRPAMEEENQARKRMREDQAELDRRTAEWDARKRSIEERIFKEFGTRGPILELEFQGQEATRKEEELAAALKGRDERLAAVKEKADRDRESRRTRLRRVAETIFERLRAPRELELSPLAPSVTLGSREAFRLQQERIARAAGTPLDEEKLAKEAVELAKKQLKEQEQTNRILEGALEVVGI